MTTKPKYSMLPYQREDRDIYAGLEFDPNNLMDLWPDNMFQDPALLEARYLLGHHVLGSPERSDVFISGAAFICYDRSNLNVRVGPDCCIAIGVDAAAIRERLLYLPWEVGKAPDFVLEMASKSTAEYDIGSKREIYQSIGIGEYWLFDASGGNYYEEPLIGERLVAGRYRRIELTEEADDSIRGYSPLLDLYIAWEPQEQDDARFSLYYPATGHRMETYSEAVASRHAAEERTAAAESRAATAEEESRQLREQLRRLKEQ